MPKRTDIRSILILGAGPIVIGQACEFDYSGAQACKALKAEGYRVILVNSNPATIMTDPELADATYVEPLTPEMLERIIEKERPDALLPTVGGQTALNLAIELARDGVLERYDVEMIGAKADVIEKAEDRQRFREAMERIGIECPRAQLVGSVDEALAALEKVGLPAIVRPSFTLGGEGGGIATSAPRAGRDRRARPRAFRLSAKCSWRSRCSAGRSTRWRWSATMRTTASSSAPSRTSIRWASIPAIPSRSRLP